ncbi:damage-inducible protein DinB [Sesbania bispinosa]|nr:damage-inducible protein DinB [Sesbania bispinosa]
MTSNKLDELARTLTYLVRLNLGQTRGHRFRAQPEFDYTTMDYSSKPITFACRKITLIRMAAWHSNLDNLAQ